MGKETEVISNLQPPPLAWDFCNASIFRTEWLKSQQIGFNDDAGFGQCSSHFLSLKGNQTMKERLVQKGNNKHAGPLPP